MENARAKVCNSLWNAYCMAVQYDVSQAYLSYSVWNTWNSLYLIKCPFMLPVGRSFNINWLVHVIESLCPKIQFLFLKGPFLRTFLSYRRAWLVIWQHCQRSISAIFAGINDGLMESIYCIQLGQTNHLLPFNSLEQLIID